MDCEEKTSNDELIANFMHYLVLARISNKKLRNDPQFLIQFNAHFSLTVLRDGFCSRGVLRLMNCLEKRIERVIEKRHTL